MSVSTRRARLPALWWSLFVLGAAVLVGLVLHAGLPRVLAAVATSRWDLVLLSSLAFCGGQTVRGAKWAYLIGSVRPDAPRLRIVECYYVNTIFSNWTPARSGEALAPLLLAQRAQTPLRLGAAVVLLDRALDVAALVLAAGASSLYLAARAAPAEPGPALAGSAAILALLALPSAGSGSERPRRGLARRAGELLAALRGALAEVAQPARLARAGAMTLAAWLLDFAATYWIVNAITPLSLVHSAVCQSLAAGAALVSFVPGGLGVATASFVGVADVLGADWQAVAAAGVLAVVLNQALRGGLALAALAHWARGARAGS